MFPKVMDKLVWEGKRHSIKLSFRGKRGIVGNHKAIY